MRDRLRRLLAAPSFPGDEERARRASATNVLALAILLLCLLLSAVAPFLFARVGLSVIFAGGISASMLAPLILLRRGQVQAAGVTLVCILWLLTTAFVCVSGGPGSPSTVYLFVSTFIAGLLLGVRAMIVCASATSAAGLALVLLARAGIAPPRLFPVPPLAGWMDATIVLAFIVVFLDLTLGHLARALAATRAELAERKKAEAAAKRLEAQLQEAQKMEAVGRLAGGVAHDFNNLLTAIFGNLELARLDARSPDQLELLDEIGHAADSATALTRQLLAFSRRQIVEPRDLDLGELVATLHKMIVRLIGEDIQLELVRPAAPLPVRVDPGQIEQALLNLVVNSRDAMPSGGRLTIELREGTVSDEQALRSGRPPGAYVVLAVSDTGVGIDKADLDKIFDPFFTTKPVGKGTGLGLSTVYGMVTQSGGFISVYSEVNLGTTFNLHFPRAARTGATAAPLPRPAGGSETILLVEDDAVVRELARRVLEGFGYTVLACADADEGIAAARAHAGAIDLLLTDVVMPGKSGRVLAEELAPLRPEMRVLFTPGYTDDVVIRHGVLEAGIAFLGKPYSPDSLGRKVREVLDSATAGTGR
jgi:signal transduction histidine kinase/ActR/RegA family two-component response regulator